MHKFAKPKHIPPHLTTGSEEAGEVVKVFKAITPDAYTISVPRRKANAGVADHLFFLHQRRVLLAWDSKAGYEYKPPSHPLRLEPEQKIFGDLMSLGYRTMFGWGDRDNARQWLQQHLSVPPAADIPRAQLIETVEALVEAVYDLKRWCITETMDKVRDGVRQCRKAVEATHDAAWPMIPPRQP